MVLDFGFWRRDERDRAGQCAAGVGAGVVLHALDCDQAQAWRRVAARNRAADRSLYIARATFASLRQRFEPLGKDEVFVRE